MNTLLQRAHVFRPSVTHPSTTGSTHPVQTPAKDAPGLCWGLGPSRGETDRALLSWSICPSGRNQRVHEATLGGPQYPTNTELWDGVLRGGLGHGRPGTYVGTEVWGWVQTSPSTRWVLGPGGRRYFWKVLSAVLGGTGSAWSSLRWNRKEGGGHGSGSLQSPSDLPPSVGKTASRAASLQVEPDTVFSTKGRDRWAGLGGHGSRPHEARMSQGNKSELALLQVGTSPPPPTKIEPSPRAGQRPGRLTPNRQQPTGHFCPLLFFFF